MGESRSDSSSLSATESAALDCFLAEVQRGHRDRRNRSVDIMRRVVPGVSKKLDTAGVLENSINYVLYLHKQLDVESISEEFRYNESNRKLGSKSDTRL